MSKRVRHQGELEQQVLDVLWDAKGQQQGSQAVGALNSQQIQAAIVDGSDLALTTVLTVLSRLVDKELVIRQTGEGRSLLFSAAQSREQRSAELLLKIVAEAGNPALAFSHFADGLTAEDLAALRASLGQASA